MIIIEMRKSKFLVEDEKKQNHLLSKGFGERLERLFVLSAYEALYLVEKGKGKIMRGDKELGASDIYKEKGFSLPEYLVYKDLRLKGYNIKSGLKYGYPFRVYEKGVKAGEDHAQWLVEVFEETKSLKIRDVAGKNRVAHSTNKKMLFAIVDSENSITYIENSWKRM